MVNKKVEGDSHVRIDGGETEQARNSCKFSHLILVFVSHKKVPQRLRNAESRPLLEASSESPEGEGAGAALKKRGIKERGGRGHYGKFLQQQSGRQVQAAGPVSIVGGKPRPSRRLLPLKWNGKRWVERRR